MSNLEDRLTVALTITADTVKEETLRPLAFPPRMRRRWLLALTPVAAAMAVMLIVGIEVGIGHLGPSTPPARAGLAAPTVSIGKDPAALAFDAADKTIYVLGGRPGLGLTMVGAGDCNASITSGCAQVRHTSSGLPAQDIVVDEHSRTLYVLGGGQRDAVALINAATCNATTTSGCQTRTFIHVPPGAIELAVNPRNDTIYLIYNLVGQLSVINGQTCNAADTSGCAAAVATEAAPALAAVSPEVAVDPVTDTLYYGTAKGLAVIDGRTCYGRDVLGCGRVLATVPADGRSAGLVLNQATGTLYDMHPEVGAVRVINRNTCDAVTTTGCASPAAAIRGGPIPVEGAADPAANTIYFADSDSRVYMIDASACRAGRLNGCRDAPASFPVGAAPVHLVLDPAAQTLYVANMAGTLSIINTATCNAGAVRGCPRPFPAGAGRSAPAGHHNPTYYCDGSATTYDSGLPAGPLITGSVRVAAGKVDGLPWSLWAKKGVRDPFGIEQGGVVVNGRWYGLCEIELSDGPAGNFEMIDAGAHAIAYGWAQHPQNVRFALTSTSSGRLPAPSSVHLNGLTFFITWLPESACAYHSITLHAVATNGPAWGGVENRINGACMPNRLAPMGDGGGAATWGGGVNAWATP